MKSRCSIARGLTVLLAVAASISACGDTQRDRELRGKIIGGATGAAIGSAFGSGSGQAVAVGAGAVLGTIVGGEMARR